MTTWHVFLGIVFAFCLWLGWHLSRPPWYGKLGTWKLDPEVRRASRKNSYFPYPSHNLNPAWKPAKPFRSYCLRCGSYPYKMVDFLYSKKEGVHCICIGCAKISTKQEVTSYLHQIVDVKICQNFDPHFIHPDDAMPITYFTEMWRQLQIGLIDWEEFRERL